MVWTSCWSVPPRRKSSYPLRPSLRDLLDEPTEHDRVSALFRRRSNCLCWSREPIRGTWNFTLIGPGTGDCAVRKLCHQENCAVKGPCWQGCAASRGIGDPRTSVLAGHLCQPGSPTTKVMRQQKAPCIRHTYQNITTKGPGKNVRLFNHRSDYNLVQ